VAAATTAVSRIIGAGLVPAAIEMIDDMTIRSVEPAYHVGYPMDAGAVLLLEVEGLAEATEEDAGKAKRICLENGAREVREAIDPADRERLWAGRKGAISAIGRVIPNYYVLDGVVPRTKLPEVMARVGEIGEKYGLPIANVFHAGDGNLHPCVLFDERIPGASQRVLDCGEEIMRVCVEAGGTITGEHGVGLEKRNFMPWIFTESDLEAMGRLKQVFGADERFNPCKAFPTSRGCGEIHSRALQKFGADASV
jgi:glycolate oxidase